MEARCEPPLVPVTAVLWAMRALWLGVAAVGADAVHGALEGTDRAFELTVVVGSLAVWGVTLVASLVPSPVSLTVIRIAMPAGVAAMVWTVSADGATASGVAALALAAGSSVIALAPPVGDRFTDGASYGDERRMPLRPPAALLLGPIPVAWAVCVAGAAAGPLLLADGRRVLGVVVTVVGVGAAVAAARSLYFLATRVIVFVPNGVVLADAVTLTDPFLFHRSTIEGLGPAPADTTARDLTAGAAGLALELRVTPAADLVVRTGRGGRGSRVDETAVLVTPTSPGPFWPRRSGAGSRSADAAVGSVSRASRPAAGDRHRPTPPTRRSSRTRSRRV